MRIAEHLDPETIYAHLEERLEVPRARAVEAHLWRCEACRALREECAAIVGGLEWYGKERPEPPPDYWDGFWDRWALRANERRSDRRASGRGVRWGRDPGPVRSLATAATIAVVVLGWWLATLPGEPERAPLFAGAPTASRAVADPAWEDDLEMFERATIAVGSVDPLSKGIVIAGLVEQQ